MALTWQNNHLLPALLLLTVLAPNQALAYWGWGNGRERCANSDDCDWDDWDGTGPPPWAGKGNGRWGPNRGNTDSSASSDPSRAGITASSIFMIDNVLIAHAVMACLAWVFFVPLGAMLLRIPRRGDSRLALRLHVFCQLSSYVLYIVAAGMGIWLAQQISFGQFSAWNDPHTGIGLAILVLAFIQPFLGSAHHRIFKKRQQQAAEEAASAAAAGAAAAASTSSSSDTKTPEPTTTTTTTANNDTNTNTTSKPKGTTPGFMHLWLGRALLVLALVNGGLGIRLSSARGAQNASRTLVAAIGYGVGAGIMLVLYVLCLVVLRRRYGGEQDMAAATAAATAAGSGRRAADEDDTPLPVYSPNDRSPSYTESEAESMQKPVREMPA